jgi:hypothetical protein
MGLKARKSPSQPTPVKSERYGSWTCVDGKPIWDESKRRWFFWFECNCGHRRLDRHNGDIVKGRSIQCGECAKGGNLVGDVFGQWKVIELAGISDRGERSWKCRCNCTYGTVSVIATGTLKSGNSTRCKSCNPGALKGAHAYKLQSREDANSRRELLRGLVPDDWFTFPRTQSEAKENKVNLYFPGKCSNGHIELHHISYRCPRCSREARIRWELENPESARIIRANKRQKISQDPILRMVSSLRTRTAFAFRKINSIKDSSTMEIVGCSRMELKQWIERQFHPNPDNGIEMSWDNFGRINIENNTWNVDHKIPLASAGRDWKRIMELTHYTNLQPMWAIENVKKGSILEGVRYGDKSGPKPKEMNKPE